MIIMTAEEMKTGELSLSAVPFVLGGIFLTEFRCDCFKADSFLHNCMTIVTKKI
jgi:hypothetical protein